MVGGGPSGKSSPRSIWARSGSSTSRSTTPDAGPSTTPTPARGWRAKIANRARVESLLVPHPRPIGALPGFGERSSSGGVIASAQRPWATSQRAVPRASLGGNRHASRRRFGWLIDPPTTWDVLELRALLLVLISISGGLRNDRGGRSGVATGS